MKILFTIGLGVTLGWALGECDVEGQLALEQHQLKVNEFLYRADTQQVEQERNVTSILSVMP